MQCLTFRWSFVSPILHSLFKLDRLQRSASHLPPRSSPNFPPKPPSVPNSPLADLHHTATYPHGPTTLSVLETHHCNRAIQLLSCEQTEIFSTLSSDQKGKAYRVLVELILATDMAKHKTFTLEMRDCLGTGSVPQMLILKYTPLPSARVLPLPVERWPWHGQWHWKGNIDFQLEGGQSGPGP